MKFEIYRLVGRMGWATAPLAAAAFLAGCGPDCKEDDMVDFFLDADGDGVGSDITLSGTCIAEAGWVKTTGDCDDTNPASMPGAAEICDGEDNDCDGTIDPAGAQGELTWYADSDGDGFGDAAVTAVGCAAPIGHVANSDDCNDDDIAINPAAEDVCDEIDNDCNGTPDDGPQTVQYADGDGDGYGTPKYTIRSCDPVDGYVANSEDCDDLDAASNPVGVEVCDGHDNDCDGETDPSSAIDAPTWHIDADGDGFGDAATPGEVRCDGPETEAPNGEDCDDTSDKALPGGVEDCDGLDNDCDGKIDWGLSVPTNFKKTIDAVTAAVDGDVICFDDGVVEGPIDTAGKSLTLRGRGSAVTTFDAKGRGQAIAVQNGETVTIEGMTITGGKSARGAAIFVENSDVIIDDVIISGNNVFATPTSATGYQIYAYGLLYATGSTATITDLTFTENDVTPDMGIAATWTASTLYYLYSYGGIAAFENSLVTWEGGEVYNNTLTPSLTGLTNSYGYAYSYGLIYEASSFVKIKDVAIHDNEITVDSSSPPSTASYIYAYGYGSILSMSGGLMSLDAVDITDNTITGKGGITATSNYGYTYLYGAIYGSSANLSWKNSEYSGNTIDSSSNYGSTYLYGAPFYMQSGSMSAKALTIDSNSATATNTYASTGYTAMYGNYFGSNSVTWEDVTFTNNDLSATGTYYAFMYGQLFSNSATTFTDVTIEDNSFASTCSGSGYSYCYNYLYPLYATSQAQTWDTVSYANNTFTMSSSSSYSSGYLYMYSYDFYFSSAPTNWTDVTISGNTVSNTATQSATTGYAYLYRYHMYQSNSAATWDGVVIDSNNYSNSVTAPTSALLYTYGGIMYAQSTSTQTWKNTEITDNTYSDTAKAGSSTVYSYGPFYASSSAVNWTDVTVDGNKYTSTSTGTTSGSDYMYGYYMSSSANTWKNVDFTDNDFTATATGTSTTVYNYGIYASSSALTWTGVNFDGNDFSANGTTTAYQYGIYEASAALTWNQVAFTDNTFTAAGTTSYLYPLMYTSGGTSHALTNTILAGNTLTAGALAYWGQFYNGSSTMTLTNDVIANNTTTAKYVGASQSATGNTYGVLYSASLGNYTLLNTSLDNNTFSASGATTTPVSSVFYNANSATSTSRGTWTTTYSNLYGNSGTYIYFYLGGTSGSTPVGSSGVIAKDPAYTAASTRDYTLSSSSSLINAGSTSVYDADGSTSDIGAYGGPAGSW